MTWRACLSIFFLLFVLFANAQTGEEQRLDDLAKNFLSRGLLDSAVEKLHQRAMYLKAQHRVADYISSFVEIADLYIQKEEYLKGRSYLQQIDPDSINYDNAEVRTSLIEWYLYQGYVSEKIGDYLSAKDYYEGVHLRLARPEDEQTLELGRYLYQPLGNIYTRLGEYENALLFLDKFRQLSLSAGDQNASAEAYSDLSIVYQSLGQSQEAIVIYEEALKIPGLSHKTKGLLLSNLSSALLNVGRNAEAMARSEQALTYFAKTTEQELSQKNRNTYEAWTYGVIAKVHYEQADYKRALQAIEKALNYSQRGFTDPVSREVAKLYVLKGSILLRSQSEEALQNFQLALTFLFNAFKDVNPEHNPPQSMLFAENTIVEALQGKAEAYYQHYLRSKDVALLEKALQAYELIFEVEDRIAEQYDFQRSKLLLLSERNERSHRAIDISYILYQNTQDARYIKTAFDIMERNKARVLLESQSEVRARKAMQVSKSLLDKEQEHKQAITYFQKALITGQDNAGEDSIVRENLFRAQKDLAMVNQQMAAGYPDYYRLVSQQMKLVTVKQVQDSVLLDGQALVEFFFSEHFLYVIYVEKRKISFKQITIEDDFFKEMDRYLILLRKPSIDPGESTEMNQTSFEVYQKLLKPVMNGQFVKNCIIVPDGILAYLPFETLTTQKPLPGQQMNYLLSETATSYSFSASVLRQSSLLNDVNSSEEKTFIGFAPGFMKSEEFHPLKFSLEEVDRIADLLSGSVYKNDQALKRTFLREAGQYQIVHLSTHAAVEKNSPLYSWIAFHDDPSQEADSFKLFLSEIYNLRLQADLVVLSACETGTGSMAQGEGVMSLARGFAFAGCASTVTTLWQVSDNATSRINRSFYHYLLQGWNKDEALRQAKLDYLHSDDIDNVGRHPYFWSSLVVMGDMRAIETPKQNNLLWVLLVATGAVGAIFFVMKRRRRNK